MSDRDAMVAALAMTMRGRDYQEAMHYEGSEAAAEVLLGERGEFYPDGAPRFRDIAIDFFRMLESGYGLEGFDSTPQAMAFREAFMVLTQEQMDVGDYA